MAKQEPTIREGDSSLGTVFEHPAFGCVSLSRTHGGAETLFMSNVRHSDQIVLRINHAYMRRDHYQSDHFQDKAIVEVAMSPVQFAELMGGMSRSSGVPCTLKVIPGKVIPGISMETTNQTFAKEAEERFRELARQVDAVVSGARKALDEAKVSKAKQAPILAPLQRLEQDLRSNLPFMADQFRESMEKVVVEAKSVVESYALSVGVPTGTQAVLLGNG